MSVNGNNTNKKRLLEQHHIPIVGEFKQLLGGAMTWVTMLIFLFSGLAAWNTDTLALVRDHLPWFNLVAFVIVVVVGLLIAMWLEHKWVQPSVMAYWNKMNYDHNNPLRTDHVRMEKKVDLLLDCLAKKDPELAADIQRRLIEDSTETGKLGTGSNTDRTGTYSDPADS